MPIIFVLSPNHEISYKTKKEFMKIIPKKNIQLTHEQLFGKEEATGLLLFI